MAATASTASNQDHTVQVIKKYRTYVGVIVESNIGKILVQYINLFLVMTLYCTVNEICFVNTILLYNELRTERCELLAWSSL